MKFRTILVCMGTYVLVTPFSKGRGGRCPRNASPFRRPWLQVRENEISLRKWSGGCAFAYSCAP